MKKILIVGVNGYIGSKFNELYKKKYIIKGIDKNYFKKCKIGKSSKINIIEKCASKLNYKDLREIDALIFLASYNNDPILNINNKKIYTKEVKYTLKAAKMCKKKKIRFIFTSSCSVYGFGKKIFKET